MNKDDDDRIAFQEEEPSSVQEDVVDPWKVLIVDDDKSVHEVSRMILGSFVFENRPLHIISAYNETEARDMISGNPDLALILLDVVMTEDDGGLKLVRYIREEQKNRMVRIILRTGQPGQAPEKKVVLEYDINDYKLKTELTADKLFVTIISALRAYWDLQILNYNRIGLERIIDSSATLFKQQSFREFISGVLIQMTSIMHLSNSALYCRTSGITANKKNHEFLIESGIGEYQDYVHAPIENVLGRDVLKIIYKALREEQSIFLKNSFVAYFKSKENNENFIYMRSACDLSPWDKKLIAIFCTNISVALENINLGQAIEDTQKDIILTLGEVAEARSKETGHHVKRVAEYSKLIARKYGLSEKDSELLGLASPMHDVGKLSVSDEILNKPGPLTDEEMKIIQTHALAGYDMLKVSNRPLLNAAAQIALEHHEKYDGTGYPYGKKGENISIYGRIVAIADVFDALGCDRIYKKAWPDEEILQYFQEQKGRHFDPELAELFVDNFEEFTEIRKKFPE